jgi:hypothetical protein
LKLGNKSENISSKKPRSETISQANKKVVNNTPSRPLLPLEPNLVDTDVMNEFDLEPYMDDSSHFGKKLQLLNI